MRRPLREAEAKLRWEGQNGKTLRDISLKQSMKPLSLICCLHLRPSPLWNPLSSNLLMLVPSSERREPTIEAKEKLEQVPEHHQRASVLASCHRTSSCEVRSFWTLYDIRFFDEISVLEKMSVGVEVETTSGSHRSSVTVKINGNSTLVRVRARICGFHTEMRPKRV